MYSEKLRKVCNAINSFYGQKSYYTDNSKPYIAYDEIIQKIWIHTPINSYCISWNYYINGNYVTVYNSKTNLRYKFRIQHTYKDILKAMSYVFKLCEFEHRVKNPMRSYYKYILK